MQSTARQLDSSTARQLDSSTARTDLDRPRQLLDAQAHAVSLDGLDSYSTATRQLLDRLDKQGLADSPSTAARRLLGRSAVETEPLDRSAGPTATAARQGSTRAQVVKRVRNVWVAAA